MLSIISCKDNGICDSDTSRKAYLKFSSHILTICFVSGEAHEPDDDSDEEKSREETAGAAHSLDSLEEEESLSEARKASGSLAGPSDGPKPVWEDPEDETIAVDVAALGRLRKLRSSEAETVLTGGLPCAP